ncbi:MAG TPA: hypothetical protein VHI95_16240, partial [Acidimicrobiales bacterium]|nr:hypothetical protein [Acidimicrobiales bacterium]
MFGRVDEIETQLEEVSAEFEPDALDAGSVVSLYETFDRIERLAAANKLRLARRVDEVEQWKRSGYPSAAEYLAAKSGSTVAA